MRRAATGRLRPIANTPTMIYARYLRGGRWVPVRVGALSLKGAALLTGALPRLDDRVDVALIVRQSSRARARRVGKVSTMREATLDGRVDVHASRSSSTKHRAGSSPRC